MKLSMKAARINKGLTQQDVADSLRISRETVCSWEIGKTVPKIDKIGPLCALYGVEYDDIDWERT